MTRIVYYPIIFPWERLFESGLRRFFFNFLFVVLVLFLVIAHLLSAFVLLYSLCVVMKDDAFCRGLYLTCIRPLCTSSTSLRD